VGLKFLLAIIPRLVIHMSEVTLILSAIKRGDPNANQELLSLLYDELRRLAALKLAQEKPGHTLQPTALVHEAYIRLLGGQGEFANRGHFFAAAAEAMRRILIESARRKNRERHGGGRQRVELLEQPAPDEDQKLLDLDEALTRLAKEDPLASRVVELRYFAGLSHEGIAEALGITVYQARQTWTYARAWLRDAVGPD
jgi:RNA polymerase sigma factor (TIGR02999 family)